MDDEDSLQLGFDMTLTREQAITLTVGAAHLPDGHVYGHFHYVQNFSS